MDLSQKSNKEHLVWIHIPSLFILLWLHQQEYKNLPCIFRHSSDAPEESAESNTSLAEQASKLKIFSLVVSYKLSNMMICMSIIMILYLHFPTLFLIYPYHFLLTFFFPSIDFLFFSFTVTQPYAQHAYSCTYSCTAGLLIIGLFTLSMGRAKPGWPEGWPNPTLKGPWSCQIFCGLAQPA